MYIKVEVGLRQQIYNGVSKAWGIVRLSIVISNDLAS